MAEPAEFAGPQHAQSCRGVVMKLGGRRVCVAAGRACDRQFSRAYGRVNLACADGVLYLKAKVLAAIPVGAGPNAIRYLDGSVWVRNFAGGSVSRIDPASNSVVATIPTGGGWGDLTYGDGSIWDVAEETGLVSRIDPTTNSVIATISTQGIRPMGVAWTPGSIWAGNHAHRAGEQATVVRIDTATNQVVWRTGVGQPSADESGGPVRLTAAFGSDLDAGPERRRPRANRPGQRRHHVDSHRPVRRPGRSARRVDLALRWVLERHHQGRPDYEPRRRPCPWPVGNHEPAGRRRRLPLGDDEQQGLLKVDPATGKVVGRWWQPAEAIFGNPALVACGDGSIWVSDSPRNRVLRLAP
jgi:streptogramin lyase